MYSLEIQKHRIQDVIEKMHKYDNRDNRIIEYRKRSNHGQVKKEGKSLIKS